MYENLEQVWPDGVEPLSWAADHGAHEVLDELLDASPEPARPDSPARAALEVARRWLDVDPEQELVPYSYDWRMSEDAVTQRLGHDGAFRWAAPQLTETSVEARGFAVAILHRMCFDVPFAAEEAFAAEAVEALRPRLTAETDINVLDSVIGAFSEYSGFPADLPEILPLARHSDPLIRSRVAAELRGAHGVSLRGDRYNEAAVNPAVMEVLRPSTPLRCAKCWPQP